MLLARQAGSFDFESHSGGERRELEVGSAIVVFLLALVGFGTKAGLIPLHVWLPRAHPAAPSHVSALMSGVMVKMAIFGLLRLTLGMGGAGAGVVGRSLLFVAGAVSAVLGILYALMERDLKRVLAYSTVEHVGIICLGLGSSLMLAAGGHPTGGGARAPGDAGSPRESRGLQESPFSRRRGCPNGCRDPRSGAARRAYPADAADGGAFLVGSVAIAALPPLNGFAGEWLLFQGLLQLGVRGRVGWSGNAGRDRAPGRWR